MPAVVTNHVITRQAQGAEVAAVWAGQAKQAAAGLVAPSRLVYLDAAFPDLAGPATSSAQGALTHARAVVAPGGRAEIRLGYKADGTPYAASDLEDAALPAPYGSDALDERIALVRVGGEVTGSGYTVSAPDSEGYVTIEAVGSGAPLTPDSEGFITL